MTFDPYSKMECNDNLEDDLAELVEAWETMSQKFHEHGFPEDSAAYEDCAEKLSETLERHRTEND